MGAVKMMKGGSCMALLVVSVLLNAYCCGAASVEVLKSTNSGCGGSADECLTMDLELDFFMGSDIGRMLGAIHFVTPGSGKRGQKAVPGPKGTSYKNNLPPPNGGASKCGQQNRGCRDIFPKPH